MGSVFRKIIIHRVPAAATRTPSKAGEVRVSWTNRQRRKCSGKLRVGKAGEERVSYRSPEYYIRFRDEHQVLRTERSHTTDKDLAQNLLRQREKEVLELQLDPSRARRAVLVVAGEFNAMRQIYRARCADVAACAHECPLQYPPT